MLHSLQSIGTLLVISSIMIYREIICRIKNCAYNFLENAGILEFHQGDKLLQRSKQYIVNYTTIWGFLPFYYDLKSDRFVPIKSNFWILRWKLTLCISMTIRASVIVKMIIDYYTGKLKFDQNGSGMFQCWTLSLFVYTGFLHLHTYAFFEKMPSAWNSLSTTFEKIYGKLEINCFTINRMLISFIYNLICPPFYNSSKGNFRSKYATWINHILLLLYIGFYHIRCNSVPAVRLPRTFCGRVATNLRVANSNIFKEIRYRGISPVLHMHRYGLFYICIYCIRR